MFRISYISRHGLITNLCRLIFFIAVGVAFLGARTGDTLLIKGPFLAAPILLAHVCESLASQFTLFDEAGFACGGFRDAALGAATFGAAFLGAGHGEAFGAGGFFALG